MSDWTQINRGGGAPAQAPASGGLWAQVGKPSTAPAQNDIVSVEEDQGEEESPGISPGAVAAGAGVGAAGIWGISKLARMPGIIGKLGKGAEYVDAARKQLMLSGMAVPKSLLGNVGAAVEAGVERKSMAPLKSLFSRQTMKDARTAYKSNAGLPGPTDASYRGMTLPGPMPGRIMGAMDEATQSALKRGGLSADEAQSATLQAPLTGRLASAMDSPVARYIHPFRRTPFNQFLEGLEKMKGATPEARRGLAVYGSAGATHGAATADDEAPISIPLAIAASARYGMPYGIAALVGRHLAGGRGTGRIASSVLPVSEYGIDQAATDPLAPMRKPAFVTAIEKMTGSR